MDITYAVRTAAVAFVAGVIIAGCGQQTGQQQGAQRPTGQAVAQYDRSIDPDAPVGALWTKTNPTAADCIDLRTLNAGDELPARYVYGSAAPCQRAGLNRFEKPGPVEFAAVDGSATLTLHVAGLDAWVMVTAGLPPTLVGNVRPAPRFDRSIDPDAPEGALWTKVNPTAGDCAILREMVGDSIAPEAVYDPKAPCQKSGLNRAAGAAYDWTPGPDER